MMPSSITSGILVAILRQDATLARGTTPKPPGPSDLSVTVTPVRGDSADWQLTNNSDCRAFYLAESLSGVKMNRRLTSPTARLSVSTSRHFPGDPLLKE